jgi:hypothetical protein
MGSGTLSGKQLVLMNKWAMNYQRHREYALGLSRLKIGKNTKDRRNKA